MIIYSHIIYFNGHENGLVLNNKCKALVYDIFFIMWALHKIEFSF